MLIKQFQNFRDRIHDLVTTADLSLIDCLKAKLNYLFISIFLVFHILLLFLLLILLLLQLLLQTHLGADIYHNLVDGTKFILGPGLGPKLYWEQDRDIFTYGTRTKFNPEMETGRLMRHKQNKRMKIVLKIWIFFKGIMKNFMKYHELVW